MGGVAYPVFDAVKGTGGRDRRLTYPTEQPGLGSAAYTLNRYVVPEDGALVATAGHMHPGGLYTDLWLERGGRRVHLFRSEAHYWEPAGPVSWDMAMTATPADWRVQVRRGDVLEVTGTYDDEAGLVVRVDGDHAAGLRAGRHGRRPVHHEGRRPGRADARPAAGELQPRRRLQRPARSAPHPVDRAAGRRAASTITASSRARGDINVTGRRGRIPTVRAGPLADVRQPRRRRNDLPHDHLLPRAVQPRRPASPTRSPTGARSSTPASSAAARRASRRRPTA